MKCRDEEDIILSSYNMNGDRCSHKFCQNCFRKENKDIVKTGSYNITCPCCHAIFHYNIQSIDEAILIGEATTLSTHKYQFTHLRGTEMATKDVIFIYGMNRLAIEKLETALQLNQSNFYTIYLLLHSTWGGFKFIGKHNVINCSVEFYTLKLFDYIFKLLAHPETALRYGMVSYDLYSQLSTMFYAYRNYPTALKYSKLSYEQCLRSSDHTNLLKYKDLYLKSRDSFAKLPPLRFAVGDEVEFLHERETGSEWRLGKVVELYYRESSFAISFTSPYRLQLLDEYEGDPPVYGWVKADLDRDVRKVGVRSIEDTRYQARLNAKVKELHRAYCSHEFIQDIYRTLALDPEFVEMLLSVWEVDLSESMLNEYRLLAMYRQPLLPTGSGYHVPSSEEVIAEIKAYFDPALLTPDAPPLAEGEESDVASSAVSKDSSQEIRNEVLRMFRGVPSSLTDRKDVQGLLLRSIKGYLKLSSPPDSSAGLPFDVSGGGSLYVPYEISEAISSAVSEVDLELIQMGAASKYDGHRSTKLGSYVDAWIALYKCLELPNVGSACECPYVYFFIKFCLDHGTGVPKLALALYDRMNMQLSREFIRCANPTCELNKLDQSTGEVKFKLCSRCRAVIYCSKECQTAHYPEHKRLCREHT